MPDLIKQYSTNRLDEIAIGPAIDYMMQKAKDSRRMFERTWYDNNFFDDGYHFRYLTRTENKIVDLSERATIYAPLRAIPKASRQIRGIANLLSSRNYVPVIYPERISTAQYPPLEQLDQTTGQYVTQSNPQYQEALKEAKRIAKLSGHWVEEEFKKQQLLEKIAFMIILSAKHNISWMQVWPDAIHETIRTQVFDAFDVFILGSFNNSEDLPFIIKTRPRIIAEIKADERFDIEKVMLINPDNRHASSDIKEAYQKARHGGISNPDVAATVIEKEVFIKEYLDDDNMSRVRTSKNGELILKGKEKGDIVIRHTFGAGNITLKDEYVNLPGYPLIPLTLEPGPLYQTALMQRFIPSNKSLDMVVSRVERYLHTMVAGSWSIKSGEPAEPTNTPGGQIFHYNTTPPTQNPIAPIPAFVFNFLNILESFIEEQGVTTTALGKIPRGVKAHAAIESLKESEFANLTIASEQVKGLVKRIAEKMLDLADNYFIEPQTVYYLEKGEPQYFDIIGNSALEKRKEIKVDTPQDVIAIKKDYRVEIDVQSGLAYTREGQKEAAKELGDYLIQLSQIGLVSPEVIKEYFRQLLEVYQFGGTKEIMEAMDQYGADGQMLPQQVDAMKVALAEVFKDLQQGGILPTSEQRIEEGKVATAETFADIQRQPNSQRQEV